MSKIAGGSIMAELKRADLSLKLLVLGMSLLFFKEALQGLAIAAVEVAYAGYFILFFSLYCSIREGKFNALKHVNAKWVMVIWFFAAFMLLYGIIMNYELRYLFRDIWPFTYFAALLVAAQKKNWKVIDWMIYSQFLIGLAVVFYVWAIYGMDIARDQILEINVAAEAPSLYFAWQITFAWPYLLLTYSESSTKRKIVTVAGTAIHLLLALFFLKRMPFITIAMLGLLVLFVKGTILRPGKNRAIASGIPSKVFTLGLILITFWVGTQIFNEAQQQSEKSYISDISGRLVSEGGFWNTFARDDRLSRTPSLIVSQAAPYEILFGQGLGSTVMRDNEPNTTVESGIFSFFFKGGIIYVALWYFGLLGSLKGLFKERHTSQINFHLLVVLYLIMSPISSIYNMFPLTGYILLYLGRSMARDVELPAQGAHRL